MTTTAKDRFQVIQRRARNVVLTSQVWDVLTGAEENANDTVYVEKAAPETEWHQIALDSIGVILSMDDIKPATRGWFTRNGYQW